MTKKIKLFFTFLLAAVCCFSLACLVACSGSGTPASEPSELEVGPYLSEENIALDIGESRQLTVGNGKASSWTTSDAQIAAVENGLVSGVSEGVAFISVSVGEETLVCVVTVSASEDDFDIVLSHQSRTLNVGDVVSIYGSVYAEGAETDDAIAWSVSDPEVLGIEADGNTVLVTAKKAGPALLTATAGASTAVCEITVKAAYNTQGAFDGCADMASAKVTQNAFTAGSAAEIDVFSAAAPADVYQTAYYGEYLDNSAKTTDALVLFATLDETVLGEIGAGKYCRYGFLVQAVQITDDAYLGYQDQAYLYYATQGNQDGMYGVFIEGIPQGYYRAWAFVETMSESGISLLRTEESVAAGSLVCNAVEDVSQIHVKIADGNRWGYGTPVPGEAVAEVLTDSNEREIEAKYAFDTAKSNYAGDNQYYYSPKMQIDLGLTETMLKEFAASGYSRFTFWIYYRTDASLASTVSYLDLNKFEGATVNDGDDQMYSRFTAAVSAPTNTWVRVQYDASLLAEYYDVLFGWNTPYPLFHYSSSASGILYVSDIAMEKTVNVGSFDPEDLLAENYDISANFGDDYNPYNGRETLQAEKCEDTEITDQKGVSKSPKFMFKAPASDNTSGYVSLGIFQNSEINKTVLQDFAAQGYTKLVFYVLQEYRENNQAFVRKLNLSAINAENSDGDDTYLDKSSFTYINPDNGYLGENMEAFMPAEWGYSTNQWIEVKYDLEELIQAYDIVWETGTSWPLVRFGIGRKLEEYTMYVSAFSLYKPAETGEIDPANVVTDETLFTAKRINYEYTESSLQNNVLGTESVTAYGQEVSDRLNAEVSKLAAFKIALSEQSEPWANTVAFTLSSDFMTKEAMQEMIEQGYETLSFSVYRQYAMTDPWENGMYVRTIDFEKMRANNASVNDTTTAKQNYTSHETGGSTNTWYTVTYNLSDLLEFYDVLFAENTPYFLCEAGTYFNGANDALYISAFSLYKPAETGEIDPANVVTDETLFTAKRINYEYTESSLQNIVLGTESVTAYGQEVSDRLNAEVSKLAAFKIALSEQSEPWANTVAFTLSSDFMTKEAMQEMIEQGYETLSFSVYRQYAMTDPWENGMYVRTIDFEKMRANNASVNDTTTAKQNYTSHETGGSTNTWYTVTYNLSDLLEFYDVLFAENTPYFLCEAGTYSNGANDALYISAFSLGKA